MIFIDELKDMVMYKKQFLLPLNKTDRKIGSSVFLLTPNINSSIKLMNNPLISPKQYQSYYLERNAMFYINSDGITEENVEESTRIEILDELFSGGETTKETERLRLIFPKILDQITHGNHELKEISKRIPKLEAAIDILESDYDEFKNLPVEEKMERKRLHQCKGSMKVLFSLLGGPSIIAVAAVFTSDMFDDLDDFENDMRITIDYSKRALRYLRNEKRKLEQNEKDLKDFGIKESYINEGVENDPILRRILYTERLKNSKELLEIYDIIKTGVPYINKTYLDYERYKGFNLIIDSYYYTETFFKNNTYTLDKGVNLYMDFLTRFLKDKRLESSGYKGKKYVLLPIIDWQQTIAVERTKLSSYTESINPLSMIYRIMKTNYKKLDDWKDFVFVFIGDKSYFKIDFSNYDKEISSKFLTFINKLTDVDYVAPEDDNMAKDSQKSISTTIIDSIEKSMNLQLSKVSDTNISNKDEIIQKIEDIASTNSTIEDTTEELAKDEDFKALLAKLATEESDGIQINASRSKRINSLQSEFLKKKVNNKTVADIINFDDRDLVAGQGIPVTSLPIDSVNEEWQNLTYMNFEKNYNVYEDIISSMYFFSDKSMPIVIREYEIVDNSTSEDYVDTYIFKVEDAFGKRFTIKFDIPKFKDGTFMLLKGNTKAMNGQRMLLPIIKTDEDTVQIVSDYNKIFIRRFGNKPDVNSDLLKRTLAKLPENTKIKVSYGDTHLPNKYYELLYDYTELSKEIVSIEDKTNKFIFSQKTLEEYLGKNYKEDANGYLPIGYRKSDNVAIYPLGEVSGGSCSSTINLILRTENKDFNDIIDTLKPATKYMYSRCSVLNTQIPLIVVLSYSEGLTSIMKKAGVKYEFSEKKPKIDISNKDIIRFSDGYLTYDLTLDTSLLMNGLKECPTESYSIGDINNKMMWIDFLENYGSRLLADGLENFYELMINPVTKEILMDYGLPTEYTEVMLYANQLLCDNKYIKHTDVTGSRYRSNELVAAYAYKILADAYGDYKSQVRHNRKDATLSIKQSAVIDAILLNSTTSDKSDLNPLLELETKNAISSKGLSGMNSDRAYDLDKRAYDESMVNIMGLSTGFAGNVGVTRQTTIDMNVEGKRGYFKVAKSNDEMSITKTFTATEALTPYGATRDDPMRTAMNFIQTSSHQMRVEKSSPMLISNGMDEALPYMVGDTYSFKSKKEGKIIELTDEYMVVEYKDGTHDFVDLRNTIKKNSAGGFYISIKLQVEDGLKVGSKVKENQVLAYDPLSFSHQIGIEKNLSYNSGTLIKCAIINTDDGYEDSTKISEWLSEALTSDVVIKQEIQLPKTANVYNMVKIGDPLQEGDPLLIYQNGSNEEDIAKLLRNITDEKLISELGRIVKHSKVTGVVEDIKIYRTVEKEELSPTLLKQVNSYEKVQKDMKKVLEKYEVDHINRYNDDSLAPTGKLKNSQDGVLIEFYLRYHDKMSIGDKLVYHAALKGVVSDIYPKGKEPSSELRPDEKIDSLLAISSVNARMVGSVILNCALNKAIVELDRHVKDILEIPIKYFNED